MGSFVLSDFPRLEATAHDPSASSGSATIKHPYHPLHGNAFPVLKTRCVGGVDSLILRGTSGGTFGVPLAWTDLAEPSPWELLEKDPPIFSAPFLWVLVELIDSLATQDAKEGES
jgi:hypothetical protein